MSVDEIYFSVDVEHNGPAPGRHSILQLGCVAFTPGAILGAWSANFAELTGAGGDPATKAWWEKQDPALYASIRTNLQPAGTATRNWIAWVRSFGGKAVAVASPTASDWSLISWYINEFCPGFEIGDRSPFGHRCLDLRSFTMPLLGRGYLDCGKEAIKALRPSNPLPHHALHDALEQAVLFQGLLNEAVKMRNAAAAGGWMFPTERG